MAALRLLVAALAAAMAIGIVEGAAIEECDSTQLEPVEGSCNIYTKCVGSKKLYMQCPDGTFFSRALQACVDKSDSDCGQKIPCSGAATMAEPTDCTKYTQCVNGFVVTKSCGKGLHFNPFAHTCQHPKDAHCEVNRPCSSWYPYDLGPVTCSGNGKTPNCCDCRLYKICVKGKVEEKHCPDDMHFNKYAQQCMKPCDAYCDLSISCGGPPPPPPPPPPPKCNGTEKSPVWCDCTVYRECVKGENVTRICPKGQHFSRTELKCMDICEAGCEKDRPECIITTSNPIPKNCTGDGKAPVCGACSVYSICVNGTIKYEVCKDGKEFSPFAHECMDPKDAHCEKCHCCEHPVKDECNGDHKSIDKCGECEYYTECTHEKISRKKCPPGMHFNEFAHVCQEVCEARCDPKRKCPGKPTKCHCSGTTLVGDPKNCSIYKKCVNGVIQTMHCPAGQHFNAFSQKCDTPCEACCDSNTMCPPKEVDDIKCSGAGKKPHPDNCHLYLECKNGIIKEFSCPGELDFNPHAQECQSLKQAHCDDRVCKPQCVEGSVEPHPCDCRLYIQCEKGEPEIHTCHRLHFNPISKKCEHPYDAHCTLPHPAFSTDCIGDFLVPHEDSCTGYYECHNGVKVPKECPLGTAFSTSAQKCLNPADPEVDCRIN